MIESAFRNEPRVEVTVFSGLTATLAANVGASCILRGVRMVKDFEYGIDPGIEDKIVVNYFYYSEIENRVIEEKSRKYKVYTTNKGDYFNFKGIRIYLHDFIRVC